MTKAPCFRDVHAHHVKGVRAARGHCSVSLCGCGRHGCVVKYSLEAAIPVVGTGGRSGESVEVEAMVIDGRDSGQCSPAEHAASVPPSLYCQLHHTHHPNASLPDTVLQPSPAATKRCWCHGYPEARRNFREPAATNNSTSRADKRCHQSPVTHQNGYCLAGCWDMAMIKC